MAKEKKQQKSGFKKGCAQEKGRKKSKR